MRKAAIAIDSWKLPIFSKHLREAGFSYDTGAGFVPDMIMLQVDYTNITDLGPVIIAAQLECAEGRPK